MKFLSNARLYLDKLKRCLFNFKQITSKAQNRFYTNDVRGI